jgi:hypothetical protein
LSGLLFAVALMSNASVEQVDAVRFQFRAAHTWTHLNSLEKYDHVE